MAASRYYPTIRPPGSSLFGPPLGTWSAGIFLRDNRGPNGHWTWLLDQSKASGGFITHIDKLALGIGSEDIWSNIRWVTPRLAAQTLGGNLQVTMMVSIDAAAVSAVWKLYAYLTVGDSLTQRAVLLNNFVDTHAWTSTGTFRNLTLTATLPAQAVTSGDRIVIELGSRFNTAVKGPAYSLFYGTTDGSNVAGADAVDGSTDATKVGWVEFSAGITELGGDHPAIANSTCATAIVISPSALPYQDGPYDTIGSADANKAAWYAYTPTDTERVFVHTFGSNHATQISAFTGTCGAPVLKVDLNTGINKQVFLGTGQSALAYDLTGGTAYHFRVQCDTSVIATQAIQSGGSLVFNIVRYQAPQTDDLYVNCQHILGMRDGLVTNMTSFFYASTPVGSAIDYTGRPLLDSNTGLYVTATRLFVGLFGSNALVEIFDLATLEVAAGFLDAIDYFLNVFQGATRSKYENSIVFDQAGRIYLGFLGDATNGVGSIPNSVQGAIGSADSVAVRRVDGTHADNQPGHPFALADRFDVAQDVGGSWFVEIASDQKTLFYTSSGTKVKRFDVDANIQLADFATVPSSGPRPGLRSIRLLPPGDGTGGALVANGDNVVRLDGSGNIIHTYTPTATTRAQDLDKVEITNDGQKFWVSDQYTTDLWKFQLNGTEELHVESALPPGQLCGFSIYNGYRAGISPNPPSPFETIPIRRMRQFTIPSVENYWIFCQKIELEFQRGVGLVTGQGSDPQIMFQLSRDGGKTWGSEIWRSAGPLGEYQKRAIWRKLGRARNPVGRFIVSDPVFWAFQDCYFDGIQGTS